MTSSMQALVTAIPNTAVVQNVPIPEPGPNEVRVKVHAVALNPVDALYVSNLPCDPGRIVGSDIAGIVEKIGAEVKSWKIGDRIAGLLQGATTSTQRPGGFAEYAILEEDLAIRIPSGVSFEEAATLPLCSLTAAQALFIRLELKPPFSSPFKFDVDPAKSPTILIYSAATSLGLFAIGLIKLLRSPSGSSYRIFATASPKNHQKLKEMGVEAVFDYNSATWTQDVKRASGGISYAFDCISEDSSTALISQTYPNNGNLAVVRKYAWNREGLRDGVIPLYGAVWSGLGYEIAYNNETLTASKSWREFSVRFFQFLSAGDSEDPNVFPISPNPVRLMPGGLSSIVSEGLYLLGSGKKSKYAKTGEKPDWIRPISGEKLVYRIG